VAYCGHPLNSGRTNGETSMSRIAIPTVADAPAASQPILEAVHKQLSFVPNLFRLLALSPAALAAVTGLNAALSTTLDPRTRERIALAVSQVNGCRYCLSAYSYIAEHFHKFTPEEIAHNRRGGSADPKADAMVRFAQHVTETRGKVSDADLAAIRTAGVTDAQIVEIVTVAVYYTLTNFINNVAETDIDFPVVGAEMPKAA
jgi:uncharacterized peroxidase-related enzyme